MSLRRGGSTTRLTCSGLSGILESGVPVLELVAGVFTTLLTVVVIFKLVATVQATRWSMVHTGSYIRAHRDAPPQTEQEAWELLDQHGGDFFPLGLKDRRLRAFNAAAQVTGPDWRHRVTVPFAGVFRAQRLQVGAAAVACSVNVFLPDGQWPVVGLSVAVALLSTVLVLEALLWYLVAGGYAQPFHLLDVGSPSRAAEAGQFFRLTLLAALSSTVATWTVHTQFGGFKEVAAGDGLAADFDRAAQFAYFVLSNFSTTGGSPLVPDGATANALGALVHVQTLLIVTVALTVFVNLFRGESATNASSPSAN